MSRTMMNFSGKPDPFHSEGMFDEYMHPALWVGEKEFDLVNIARGGNIIKFANELNKMLWFRPVITNQTFHQKENDESVLHVEMAVIFCPKEDLSDEENLRGAISEVDNTIFRISETNSPIHQFECEDLEQRFREMAHNWYDELHPQVPVVQPFVITTRS